jgi:hypothetical protein
MTKAQEQAAVGLVVAVFAAALFQLIAKQDAAALGLTALELALLGGAASAFVTRAVKA